MNVIGSQIGLHERFFQQACQQLAKESHAGREVPKAANWLLDNYALLEAQSRLVREALTPKLWRKLGGDREHKPHIYDLAAEAISGPLDDSTMLAFFERAQRDRVLSLAELWAILPMMKLALLDRIHEVIAGGLEQDGAEEKMARGITAIRTLEALPWNDLVEDISAVEAVLRRDPARVYAGMSFDTRDAYRQQVEKLAARKKSAPAQRGAEEVRTAEALIENAREGGVHVGQYLQTQPRFPHLVYFGSLALLLAGLMYAAARFLPGVSWWLLALLLVPLSQLALAIVHPLVNRFTQPRRLPRMDFTKGVADDCRTFVVIPTLILSRSGVENLLERIEIHYLANQDRNLLFGLLTDVPDAASQHVEKDELVEVCAAGIRVLNERHGSAGCQPFYMFHRDRQWNQSEGVWMGRERKRGKLDDFNDLLLGHSDEFAYKVGDPGQVEGIRYVITLDTDTQLPRDAARELIATMAHPLNYPVWDETNVIRRGYALLQPRVSVSMQSARRSRLANLYSGQTGLDPYTKAVSDVYQDLFGQASYTGKGIYDLEAFSRATRGRFPDNTLLSHDLIEGEHVRVGLVTDVEVVDDFPTTYEQFSKRKHRWVRGDWQIAPWMLPRVPDAKWKWGPNPLSLLSRWKIFDNLRRSLYELSLVLFFVAGLYGKHPLRTSVLVASVLLLPAFTQIAFSLLRLPPLRFFRAFLADSAWQLARGIIDGLVQLIFLLHQALLIADAIVRTLARRLVTQRRLLEWESAAQAETGGGKKLSLVAIYLFICPAVATVLSFFAHWTERGPELLALLTLTAWAASPLAAEFISHKGQFPRSRNAGELKFLRNIALRTWRYFLDFGGEEEHGLVPDNVQEDPWAVAHRSSPTNMGLQLVANMAAHDLGYLTAPETYERLEATLTALERLERSSGHFYNWYDTHTLQPLPPRYISSVDSGNLAAALVVVKQGCAEMAESPLIAPAALEGLRDHCEMVRNSLPSAARTAPIMRQLQGFCSQLSSVPDGLFHWEGLLSELQASSAKFLPGIEWLCDHWRSRQRESLDEALYWTRALHRRIDGNLEVLRHLTPWSGGALGKKLRMFSSDARMAGLIKELNRVPALTGLPAHYDGIERECRELLNADWIGASRHPLLNLIDALGPARKVAGDVLSGMARTGHIAEQMFQEMDFSFLLDRERKLMRIGFDVEQGKLDESHYDLLASEARTGVFLAIAKGDFPREAWFRLGRKLTSYGGYRTLLSWSGTMFEYLMPALFMRNFEESLLGESLRGAVRIQQLYCRTRGVPWGISEAAHAERDAARNYQYRAFGVPVMALKRMESRDLVVAPYAAMLALSIDPQKATANLKQMAERGWMGDYGFFESVDFTGKQPVIVRAFMVHHQGMAFTALANALAGGPITRRFHAEPMVQATELLLQERVPVLFEETRVPVTLTPASEREAEIPVVAGP